MNRPEQGGKPAPILGFSLPVRPRESDFCSSFSFLTPSVLISNSVCWDAAQCLALPLEFVLITFFGVRQFTAAFSCAVQLCPSQGGTEVPHSMGTVLGIKPAENPRWNCHVPTGGARRRMFGQDNRIKILWIGGKARYWKRRSE